MGILANRLVKSVHQLDAQSLGVSTVNSAGIDVTGFEEAMLVVNVGTHTTGTTAIKVQESDDNSNFTDISGASLSVTSANHNASYIGTINLKKSKRFIRVSTTVTTAAGVVAILVLLFGPDNQDRKGSATFIALP